MTRRAIPYPCIGYCTIDSRGYCVACGRPPSLGLPEVCATGKPVKKESSTGKGESADARATSPKQ